MARSGRAAGLCTFLSFAFLCAPNPAAAAEMTGATEIRVYCSGAPIGAVREIAARFSAETSDRVRFRVGQPAVLEENLAAGRKADVVILPSPVIAKLASEGTLRPQSAVDLARVGIGVAVRAGAAAPDISSAAAVRKALREARSIAYPDPRSGGGSTGTAIEQMIEQMGIAEEVEKKRLREAAIGGGVALVARGKVEIGLFNISEILPVHGVTLVGPLPAELQHFITFTAAIASRTTTPADAELFVRELADPQMRPAWQHAGLDPLD